VALRTATPPDLIDFMGVAFSDRQPDRRSAFVAQARAMAQVGQTLGLLTTYHCLGSAVVATTWTSVVAGRPPHMCPADPALQCLYHLVLPQGGSKASCNWHRSTSSARLATSSAVDAGCQTLKHHNLETAHGSRMHRPKSCCFVQAALEHLPLDEVADRMAADFMHDRLPPVLQGGPAAAAGGGSGGGGGSNKSKKSGQKPGRWVRFDRCKIVNVFECLNGHSRRCFLRTHDLQAGIA
jgi:hypothetical protein